MSKKRTIKPSAWEPLGSVTVDTAQLVLADPCHINLIDLTDMGDSSQLLLSDNGVSAVQVQTGMGDGRYQVEGRYMDTAFGRRLAEIRVRFLDDEGNWMGGEAAEADPDAGDAA